MQSYYHATTLSNAFSICVEGSIYAGVDGCIYLCETPEDACKFLAIRGIQDMYVFEVTIPDESKLQESFDHSFKFFGCKAFVYPGNIPKDNILDVIGYTVNCKK